MSKTKNRQMDRKTAEEFYDEKIGEFFSAMTGIEPYATWLELDGLGLHAAMFGMKVLAREFEPLTGVSGLKDEELESAVIHTLARQPERAKRIIEEWLRSMATLCAFVRQEVVPVDAKNHTALMTARILQSVDEAKLGPGEKVLHRALLKAMGSSDFLQPGSIEETVILRLGGAGRNALEAQLRWLKEDRAAS